MPQERNTMPSEFENKMILDARCSNKHTTYIAAELKDCIARCKVCSDMLYHVCCPKCETGYIYCKKDSELDLVKQSWYCPICKQHNKLDPYAEEVKSYLASELPAELLPKPMSPVLMIIALIIFLLLIAGVFL